MRAWWVREPGPIEDRPLEFGTREDPQPGPGEVLVAVRACGVCRTDLHVAEGDLAVRRRGIVPGHEVVGEVVGRGDGATRFAVGDRIGVAWLRSTCGRCRFCRRGDENLCLEPTFTGWTHDGGYAELTTVPEAFAHPLPDGIDDLQLAPLLCAGIIGYRAWKRAEVRPGGRLGIWGFGGSAHLTAQLALASGVEVHVVSRSPASLALAEELGAAWTGRPGESPPVPLDAAITFAPAGETVPEALAALDRGGTLAIAGIHLSDVPSLDYQRHLFQERRVVSVTANTRADAAEFLVLAERLGVRSTVRPYPLQAADQALADLAADRFTGAAVLEIG
ncbi:zinc-dependent alcohol dehydrogenase family protein [Salsipaludibacter albus]|uniref:zinc-dependent alcohol dehydrogenase family protein n=1 Tax=Salsipaludibacter albus TaxID=2849650 RepID=UPI001EE4ADA5|nr:zinc-dependent alcohol dehydrogenase family protein [Salsipaludibacter albus]MBY5161076.1 zinc-dependent alcohol dehydrogenase family protein [Salsipaludibacter albus]